MTTAEAKEGLGVQKNLQDNPQLVEVDRTKCTTSSREMYRTLARCIGSDAAAIVQSVTGLDEVEAWSKLHASRGTWEGMFTVHQQCMYPKVSNDMNRMKLAIMLR